MGSGNQRDTFVHLAKLSQRAERYDEMVESMRSVAQLNVDLTVEEMDLLIVGYKEKIGSRRTSWRKLSSVQHRETMRGNDSNVKMIKDYITKVESELSEICEDIISVINNHLIPSASEGRSTVVFNMMKGDYYRYLAEFKSGNERNEAALQSLKAYEIATTAAESEFPPTHPTRLSLALNFSAFYYEFTNLPEMAREIVRKALHEANPKNGSVNMESYAASPKIMQLLRDNLDLWNSEIPKEGVDDDVQKRNGSARHNWWCF